MRNERYLANQIPADLAWYERDRKRSNDFDQALGIVRVELDGGGDAVLLQASQLLGSLVRGSDYVVRWGDGFLLVLRPLPDRRLESIGERIREAFAQQRFEVPGSEPQYFGCSVGMVEYPLRGARQQGVGWEQMVELADAGLRWIQRHGGDGWAVLRPVSYAELPRMLRGPSSEDFEGLLRSGRLQLHASRDTTPHEDVPA